VFKLFYTTPINVQYNKPITIGFIFPWERINHFPFISYEKDSFGIRPVWYKSKGLERIKDVYRGTTVLVNIYKATRTHIRECSTLLTPYRAHYTSYMYVLLT
jgi:hypothetical protein